MLPHFIDNRMLVPHFMNNRPSYSCGMYWYMIAYYLRNIHSSTRSTFKKNHVISLDKTQHLAPADKQYISPDSSSIDRPIEVEDAIFTQILLCFLSYCSLIKTKIGIMSKIDLSTRINVIYCISINNCYKYR